jgi:hypothetical protein
MPGPEKVPGMGFPGTMLEIFVEEPIRGSGSASKIG